MTMGWDPSKPRSAWRYFPLAVVAAMAVVIAVNFGMAWSAIRTFPGAAVRDTFDHSNDYDKVLNAAAQQAAHGPARTSRRGRADGRDRAAAARSRRSR